MEYRKLGRSGLKVSPLCLGTMMFGDPTDEATSARIVAEARDAGVNFIDTADVYTNGALGERSSAAPIADEPRTRWVLATKLGNPMGDEPNRRRPVATLDHAGRRRQPRAPRHRLHRHLLPAQGRSRTPLAETVRAIGDLIRAGQDPLLRRLELSAAGASPRSATSATSLGIDRPVVSQPYYNAMNRMPEVEHLPGLRLLRPRRRALQPARARRAHRQIRARSAAARQDTRAGRSDTRMMQTEWRPESLRIAQKITRACRSARHAPPGSSRSPGCSTTASSPA